MRILYFSKGYTTHDRRFLAKISEQHDVFYLRLENDAFTCERGPIPDGVQILPWAASTEHFSSPMSWLGVAPTFQAVIKQVCPDLIHAGPIQSCGFITALAGFHPFLAMSWGSDILVDSKRDASWRWVTEFTLGRCDLLACDCQAVASEARRISGNRALPTVQFPWGIDLARFAPGPVSIPIRKPPGWQDTVVVVSNRTWAEGYAVETLLEAFALAHASDRRLRLILAGDGPLAPVVRRVIKERGLSTVVALPGSVSNEHLADYLRVADLYASCSSSDGTSISLLEAMATGLPVIVTESPSNCEWIRQPENGWLCPNGQASAFAGALLDGARLNRVDRLRIGSNNRTIVEQRADWTLNSVKLFQAYDALTRQINEPVIVEH